MTHWKQDFTEFGGIHDLVAVVKIILTLFYTLQASDTLFFGNYVLFKQIKICVSSIKYSVLAQSCKVLDPARSKWNF